MKPMPDAQNDLGLKTTLDALIRQEQDLTWSGHERLGLVVNLGELAVASLNTFIASVDGEFPFAAALMLSIHKATTLAFLSILRKHLAQSQLNLRLVIEYTSLTAYMLAHPDSPMVKPTKDDPTKFVPSERVGNSAYKWMAEAFPDQSAFLKERKDQINETLSHANIYGSHFTFDWDGTNEGIFKGSFFDMTEQHVEQTYMLAFVQTIIFVIHTLTQIADKHGGFVIQKGSRQALQKLAADTDAYAKALAAKLKL